MAADRRQKAREKAEREDYEEKRSPKKGIRETTSRRQSTDQDLNECTFKPRVKWNLAAERREKAREQRERAEYEAKMTPKRERKLTVSSKMP